MSMTKFGFYFYLLFPFLIKYNYIYGECDRTGQRPGPEVIKLFSCSIQLSMKFCLFINVKMPTTVGILPCMGGENNILCLTEPKKAEFLEIFTLVSI